MSYRLAGALLVSLGLVGILALVQTGAQEKVELKSMPQVKSAVQPVYPAEAKKTGVEGMVMVNALVDKEGQVQKAEIDRSDAPVLDKAALEAIRQWKFAPAISKVGEPVAAWVTIPVKFRLAEKGDKAGKK